MSGEIKKLLKPQLETEVLPPGNSYLLVLKGFFEEMTLISRFTIRFFKELFRPPYEWREFIK